MFYIYEIIFFKDVCELFVNEIYIKKNDLWNLYDKFCLFFLLCKIFIVFNFFCKCYVIIFKKK